MKVELPEFLIKMSKQMNEQGNRMTAHPAWQVRCKRTRPTADEYSDRFQIMDTEWDYHTVADSELSECVNSDIVDYLRDSDSLEFVRDWYKYIHINDGSDCIEDCIECFIECFNAKYDDLPEGFHKIFIEEYEDIVKSAFLTEEDANWFIKRKQHDYPELYTYVVSMHLCPQMIELREWLLSLTNP